MQRAIKLVPVVVLLTASVPVLAQEPTVETKTNPKVQEKMMTIASNSSQTTPAPGREATREEEATRPQIQALERAIEQVGQNVENGPHYLDQTVHLFWP